MTNTTKIRKNVNVSLQSKQYSKPINDILNDWTDDNLNISIEVCESILLSDKMSKSPTLSNVLTATDLIQKILNLYKVEKTDALIENILSQLITVNMPQLNEIILNSISNNDNITNQLNVINLNKENEAVKTESLNDTEKTVLINEKDIIKKPSNDFEYMENANDSDLDNKTEVSCDSEYEIPMNFILND